MLVAIPRTLGILAVMGLLCLSLAAEPLGAEAAPQVAHDLTVTLDPEGGRLIGTDRLTLTRPPARLHLHLAAQARIHSLSVDDQRAKWSRRGTTLILDLPKIRSDSRVVTLVYSATFDDAPPDRPINSDNPGYGVRGTISPRGTVLLAGSGWYPRVEGLSRSIDLTVVAPEGVLAVTSGRLLGHTTRETPTNIGIKKSTRRETVSRWQVDQPIGAVSLCAGLFVQKRKQRGGLVAMTYLTRGNQHLAARYLDASLEFLANYSERFGPYPFDHFAVVENFYPTGFGFPGFTLIGGRVLQLPFIIPTSLRHEIAHCWWGNGVRVDRSMGNWSEGLTTYVADYAYRAEQGAAAALDYRQQLMRNYTSLVGPEEAFALRHFQARQDRVTKAVGYDKAAMVFHMLHQRMGAGFWEALRDLYRERRFQTAAWTDLKFYFQRHSATPLDRFFDQWLQHADAPRLRLTAVDYDAENRVVTGRLVQDAPVYDLAVEMHLAGDGWHIRETIRSADKATAFRLPVSGRPDWLAADPDYHLFRRLWPEEIPATINTLRGAGEVVVATPPDADRHTLKMADLLPKALGLRRVRQTAGGVDGGRTAILWVGKPQSDRLPPGTRIESRDLVIEHQKPRAPSDAFFAVWQPTDTAAPQALFWSPDRTQTEQVVRKIPHYGKYSYLAFGAATNTLKGTWPVTASPLRFNWSTEQGPKKGDAS